MTRRRLLCMHRRRSLRTGHIVHVRGAQCVSLISIVLRSHLEALCTEPRVRGYVRSPHLERTGRYCRRDARRFFLRRAPRIQARRPLRAQEHRHPQRLDLGHREYPPMCCRGTQLPSTLFTARGALLIIARLSADRTVECLSPDGSSLVSQLASRPR